MKSVYIIFNWGTNRHNFSQHQIKLKLMKKHTER